MQKALSEMFDGILNASQFLTLFEQICKSVCGVAMVPMPFYDYKLLQATVVTSSGFTLGCNFPLNFVGTLIVQISNVSFSSIIV